MSGNDFSLNIKNIFFGLASLSAQVFANTICFLLIARLASVSISDFGLLMFAFSLSQILASLCDYGLSTFVVKESAANKSERNNIEQYCFGIHSMNSIVAIILFMFAISLIFSDQTIATVIMFVGTSVLIQGSYRFILSLYHGREKQHLDFICIVIDFVVLAVMIIQSYYQQADVMQISRMFLLARVFVWLTVYIIFVNLNYFIKPKFQIAYTLEILFKALPFALITFSSIAIINIEPLLMNLVLGDDAEYYIGIYQAAMRVILASAVIPIGLTRVFLPFLSRLSTEKNTQILASIKKFNNTLQCIGLLLGIYTFLMAQEIILTLYGEEYKDAVLLMRVLAATLFLRFSSAYNLYFTLSNKMWLRVVISVSIVVVSIFSGFSIGSYSGILGFAISSVLVHIVYTIAYMVFVHKNGDHWLLGWDVKFAIINAFTFIIFILILRHYSNLYYTLLFLFFYICLTIYYTLDDISKRQLKKYVNVI